MQALIDNGRYKVTEVLYSTDGYDVCLCTDVMDNTGKSVIVNTYSSREHIAELLPMFFAINQNGMRDFIELITANGSVSAIFEYHKGLSFAEYYLQMEKKGAKRDFEESMRIAENLFMRALELDLADDRIAFCALNEQSITIDPAAKTVDFNFRVLPKTVPEPMFRGKRLGMLLEKIFPVGRYLPEEIERFTTELCDGKYPTCSAVYARWREISETARETYAAYKNEPFTKYLSRKVKQKKQEKKKVRDKEAD